MQRTKAALLGGITNEPGIAGQRGSQGTTNARSQQDVGHENNPTPRGESPFKGD